MKQIVAYQCEYCNKIRSVNNKHLLIDHEKYCINNPNTNFDKYIRDVEIAANLPEGSIKSQTRKQEVVDVRFIIMYFLREKGLSLYKVAKMVNKKSHADVIHGCKNVSSWVTTDSTFLSLFERIKLIKCES